MHSNVAGDEVLDTRTQTPSWYARETRLAHMLPYVSLVDDQTVRTRVNELFQCIRLDGVNSYTTDDAYLDKVTALFARIIAQLGPEYSYYVHKVSKAIAPELEPVADDSFASEVDQQWLSKLANSGLRDKTLTLTVIHRPPPRSFLPFVNRSAPERLKEETQKRVRRLNEAVNVFVSGLADLKPRVLSAKTGELVGFLGALNTGQELPLYPANTYGFLSFNVANTRVTFLDDHFELSEGVVGHRFGKSFTIGEYSEATSCTMFDMLTQRGDRHDGAMFFQPSCRSILRRSCNGFSALFHRRRRRLLDSEPDAGRTVSCAEDPSRRAAARPDST